MIIRGNSASSCRIIIKRAFYTADTEIHIVDLMTNYCSGGFIKISSRCSVKLLTKMRYVWVRDSAGNDVKAAIDVYYNNSNTNNAFISIEHGRDYGSCWIATCPMLVTEPVGDLLISVTEIDL